MTNYYYYITKTHSSFTLMKCNRNSKPGNPGDLYDTFVIIPLVSSVVSEMQKL